MTYICMYCYIQGDNPRERALDMMMGGRLEANVEEDLFKVTVHSLTNKLTAKCAMSAGSSTARLHVEGAGREN